MRTILVVVLIILAVALGLWAGGWWAFIGGIVLVIDSIKATPVDALGIAYGLLRVMFSTLIGWGVFAVVGLLAAVISSSGS